MDRRKLAGQIQDKWNGGAGRSSSMDRSVLPMVCHANGLAHLELGRVFGRVPHHRQLGTASNMRVE
jgi:hypothetical protein